MRTLLLLCGVLLVACAPPVDLVIDGNSQVVTEANFFLNVEASGNATLEIDLFSDPIPQAIDDEFAIFVSLEIDDLNALPVDEPVAIGDTIQATFVYGCFCSTEGTDPAVVEGDIAFFSTSADKLQAEFDLTLNGAGENGIDLGTVSLIGTISRPSPFVRIQ